MLVPTPVFWQVFVFDVGQKTWKSYDWSQITTVAAFGNYDPDLMCYAHSKGARVVLKGMFLADTRLANAKKKKNVYCLL